MTQKPSQSQHHRPQAKPAGVAPAHTKQPAAPASGSPAGSSESAGATSAAATPRAWRPPAAVANPSGPAAGGQPPAGDIARSPDPVAAILDRVSASLEAAAQQVAESAAAAAAHLEAKPLEQFKVHCISAEKQAAVYKQLAHYLKHLDAAGARQRDPLRRPISEAQTRRAEDS